MSNAPLKFTRHNLSTRFTLLPQRLRLNSTGDFQSRFKNCLEESSLYSQPSVLREPETATTATIKGGGYKLRHLGSQSTVNQGWLSATLNYDSFETPLLRQTIRKKRYSELLLKTCSRESLIQDLKHKQSNTPEKQPNFPALKQSFISSVTQKVEDSKNRQVVIKQKRGERQSYESKVAQSLKRAIIVKQNTMVEIAQKRKLIDDYCRSEPAKSNLSDYRHMQDTKHRLRLLEREDIKFLYLGIVEHSSILKR